MDGYRKRKLSELKDEIERGTYTVDPKAVADAILRRLRDLAASRATPSRN